MANSNMSRACVVAQRLAQELGVSFKLASMDETLAQHTTETNVLFRENSDGTFTFATCGMLPTLWRERATKANVERMEAWLEGVVAVSLRPRRVRA